MHNNVAAPLMLTYCGLQHPIVWTLHRIHRGWASRQSSALSCEWEAPLSRTPHQFFIDDTFLVFG